MVVLVDFDNIDVQIRKCGLQSICSRIVHTLAQKTGNNMPTNLRVRLYGGWFEREGLTRTAQNLAVEIQRDFPRAIRWSHRSFTGACVVQVQMAYSLEVEPARSLTHTFRVREFDEKIRTNGALIAKCSRTPCPTAAIAEFFKGKKCAVTMCYMTPGDLLEKEEQKLTDTMLTADMIYLATHGQRDLGVVSSDDDLWPGIQTALLSGARVMQLHTRQKQTRLAYSNGLVEYREAVL